MASEVEQSPVYYEPLRSQLSQGDIAKDVPWGSIPHKFTVCRPVNASKDAGGASYAPPQQITRPPAFSSDRIELIHASAHLGPCMVLWHDCQIDYLVNKQGKKPEDLAKAFVAVAPIRPLAPLPEAIHEGFRKGTRPAAFYVAPHEELATAGVPGEAYVDLRFIWSVKQASLTRILSVTDVVRDALHDHIFWFLTALRSRSVLTCPQCGQEFEPPRLLESEPA